LVELLLRATESGIALPESLASEAEIFEAVWAALVRQHERIVRNVSPDDREAALMAVSRRLVTRAGAGGVPGAALPTLRSDGILLSRGRATAWQTTDSFASDVLRDFATARLLLGEGLTVLVASSGPRWAIRAARLYAQARLSQSVVNGAGAIRETWRDLRTEFAALAEAHGPRWAELPWEALISAGWAAKALAAICSELQSNPGSRDELVRCVHQRFTTAGAADPMLVAPVVAWFVDAGQLTERPAAYRDDPIAELVLSWLRGVARAELRGRDVTVHRPLRRRLGEAFLAECLSDYPGTKCVEVLSLLGRDSNAATDDALRAVAARRPHDLLDVVEAVEAPVLLAKRAPALLAALVEAYYIEPEVEPSPWGSTLMDEGIRDHGPSGLDPLAAWYRGPFRSLLAKAPRWGLVVVERMLERAARDRTRTLEDLDHRSRRAPTERDVEMSLFGSELRRFVGDAHVWYWYRGSAVGPYPCMSALLALETVLDEMVQVGLTLREVAKWVMRDARTLATPGLLYGFLVRHIEKVTDELDDFLAVPEVWELELERTVHEGGLHVQGPDSEELVGRERRRWKPGEVASYLLISAAQRGDEAAVERLRGVGQRLLAASGGVGAAPHLKLRAAALDWDTYHVRPHEDGLLVEAKPPTEVEEELAPARKRSEITMRMYALMNRYRLRVVTPYRYAAADLPDETQLAADLETVQEIVDHLPDSANDVIRMSIGGLAAALVHAAINRRAVEGELLSSAVDLLIDCASNPYYGEFSSDRTIFPDSSDRKAALVLPSALLLMARFAKDGTPILGDDPPQQALEDAIRACATSLFLEVRVNAAEGLRWLLGYPCGRLPDGRCWHDPAWLAIEDASRSTVLGPFQNGRSEVETLEGDLVEALKSRPDKDLMLTHLAPAAASVLDAAATPTCIQARAARLVPVLLDAYGRAANAWARGRYDWPTEQQAAFASAVLRSAASGNGDLVVEMGVRLSNSPGALADFLGGLVIAATYEPEHAPVLGENWPKLMRLGLATVRQADSRRGSGTDELVRKLVPSPKAFVADADCIATLRRARAEWPSLDVVAESIDEWIVLARRAQMSVDVLVGLLQAQPLFSQAEPGLRWIRSLVVAADGTARTSGFLLVGWLRSLRESNVLDATTWSQYRTIVDALALGNYRGARELQRWDE
jgi:hypothetical protein